MTMLIITLQLNLPYYIIDIHTERHESTPLHYVNIDMVVGMETERITLLMEW